MHLLECLTPGLLLMLDQIFISVDLDHFNSLPSALSVFMASKHSHAVALD